VVVGDSGGWAGGVKRKSNISRSRAPGIGGRTRYVQRRVAHHQACRQAGFHHPLSTCKAVTQVSQHSTLVWAMCLGPGCRPGWRRSRLSRAETLVLKSTGAFQA
jgi:hypothetical protein